MTNQFDITKHEWHDTDIGLTSVTSQGSIGLHIDLNSSAATIIQERDSVAIARHFYNQLSTFDRLTFINSIRGDRYSFINIKQSENTYPSLRLDSDD